MKREQLFGSEIPCYYGGIVDIGVFDAAVLFFGTENVSVGRAPRAHHYGKVHFLTRPLDGARLISFIRASRVSMTKQRVCHIFTLTRHSVMSPSLQRRHMRMTTIYKVRTNQRREINLAH